MMLRTLQHATMTWLEKLGSTPRDVDMRCRRFLEEAVELVQAFGLPKERVLAIVEYVYGRPEGEPFQEVGGVMLTILPLCEAAGIDAQDAAMTELARVDNPAAIARIREKHFAKLEQGV